MPAGFQIAPPFIAQLALALVVAAAALSDGLTRRIPNSITAPAALLGMALGGYYGGWRGAGTALAGLALGFGIFALLYLAGGMGAGDVKLFAAVGSLVGPQPLLLVFVFTGLLGGIMALGLAAASGRLRRTLAQTGQILINFGLLRWQEVRRASSLDAPGALRLPYGMVIAGGTFLFLAVAN